MTGLTGHRPDDARDGGDFVEEVELPAVEVLGRAGHGGVDALDDVAQVRSDLRVHVLRLLVCVDVGLHVPDQL